jgi:WD40 repeat protein
MKTLSLYLIVLIALTSALFSQEIPNGDGDLLWERSIYPRFVNDAKFHPINGNIIAAVNHEIWEIDPKDGHTIRVFEGGPDSGPYDQYTSINISSDGQTIVTDEGSGIKGIIIWDYQTGKIKQNFDNGETISDIQCTGIYPDNNRVIFFSFAGQGFHLNIYDIQQKKLINQKDIYPYAPDFFRLSKDGKYIAFGFRYRPNSDMIYTMELWDAETLTKIKDFGSPGDIVEFWDIQISSDNKYVGFVAVGDSKTYVFDLIQNHEEIFKGGLAIQFSNDNKKLFIQQDTSWNKFTTYIIDLNTFKPVYEYKKLSLLNYRFNNDNELFGGKEKLLFFSNKWYEVGVGFQIESQTQVNYENDQLILTLPKEGIPQKISILNLLGEIVYETCELNELNDKIVLELPLPTGIYLISLNDGQSTFYGKFVVVR